jgi:hypothetical protein
MNKNLSNLIITLTAISAFAIFVNAQTFTPKNVKNTTDGYSFIVPTDWVNQEANVGYILTNNAKTANIIVKPHNYKTYAEFSKGDGAFERDGYKKLLETTDLGNGKTHDRVGKIENGKAMILDVVLSLSKFDGGVLIIGVSTDEASADVAVKGVAAVVASLEYFAVKKAPEDTATKNAFAGKKLRYLTSGNGYRESRTIWLCKSGAYASQVESGSFSSLGTGSTSSSDKGTWQVKKVGSSITLILRSQDGGQIEYQVTARQASNEIGLNGNRYFVEQHNECN